MSYHNYTEQDNMDHASRANAYLKANPHASRIELSRAIGVSRERLARLARIGLLDRYPAPMSASLSATLGRKRGNGWGDKFFFRGSPLMRKPK